MPWAPDYATDAELAEFVKADPVAEATRLQLAVTSASRAIDDATKRQFGLVDVAEERLYRGRWSRVRRRWVVEVDDVQDPQVVTVEIGGVAVTGFTLEPVNAKQRGRPWERIVFDRDAAAHPNGVDFDVAATTLWGWAAVPDTVKEATLLQGSRFWSRKQSPYGVAGSPEVGSEVRLLARADPDVAVMVKSYNRKPRKVG